MNLLIINKKATTNFMTITLKNSYLRFVIIFYDAAQPAPQDLQWPRFSPPRLKSKTTNASPEPQNLQLTLSLVSIKSTTSAVSFSLYSFLTWTVQQLLRYYSHVKLFSQDSLPHFQKGCLEIFPILDSYGHQKLVGFL